MRKDRLEIRILGRFDVRRDGKLVVIASRAAQSLLAYLILNPNTAHRREKLAGLLWPDSPDASARRNLRQELWRLRKLIGSKFLDTDDFSITFETNLQCWLDAAALEEIDQEKATTNDLITALALYQGELLPGFYDEWIVLERERLRSIYEYKMQQLSDRLIAEQRWSEVLDWTEKWIAFGESPEPAYRALMTAHAALGDMSKVAAAFERCVKTLRDDLGVEPSQQTRDLFENLKCAKPSSTFRSPSAVSAKERNAHPSPPHNLPASLTSFIGREKEIAEVTRLISITRLLTLTGAGGVGKTRLALQVAEGCVQEFADGLWFVEFAALSDPTLVPNSVAAALGVREEQGRALMATLLDYFRHKQMLLVLDNCEHLIDACAQFADKMLRASRESRVLATSREALGIVGELGWRVPSLELPPNELPSLQDVLLTEYEAARLFIDRAVFARLAFRVTDANASAVAQICQRLDGIPLAIELAASRVKEFSAEEINIRLDDRFRLLTRGSRTALPRQQTLRATIDWSYDLLSEPERVLFRQLSVFAGGWTLHAAKEICADDKSFEVYKSLMDLVGKSLVIADQVVGETRYRMLETIRQYAREKLAQAGESEQLRDRHLDFYLSFAEDAESKFISADQRTWLDRVEIEYDNLRLALQWSSNDSRVEKCLRMAGALHDFWLLRGYWSEAYQIVLGLLKEQGANKRTLARGKTLHSAGSIANLLGHFDNLRSLFEEGISILREVGKEGRTSLAGALSEYAYALTTRDIARARACAEEAVVLSRESDNRAGLAFALNVSGLASIWSGDYGSARNYYEESAALNRELGNNQFYSANLQNIGQTYLLEGNPQKAKDYLERSLAMAREIGDKRNACVSIMYLGYAALVDGQNDEAETRLTQAIAEAQALGSKRYAGFALLLFARVQLKRGNHLQAEQKAKESLALLRDANEKSYFPRSFEVFGYIAAKLLDVKRAVRLFGAAEKFREQVGSPRAPVERTEYDTHLSSARAQLDEATFNAAREEGRAMTIEQAIAFALNEDKNV